MGNNGYAKRVAHPWDEMSDLPYMETEEVKGIYPKEGIVSLYNRKSATNKKTASGLEFDDMSDGAAVPQEVFQALMPS